ncbi:MAG: hypothetical protein NUV76_05890 [Candidatus Kuenenia sp.]|nr:hypothetical protein [Candidatus Kuenenia sp.]
MQSRNLFYPSSGTDLRIPVETFLPWISDFWFVDHRYDFNKALREFLKYEFINQNIYSANGITIRKKEAFEVKILSRTFRRKNNNKIFRIHKCCGRGYDTFRRLIKDEKKLVSFFFYRGDSFGDGGSGFYWLRTTGVLKNVLESLENNGLIITDGSNADKHFKFENKDYSWQKAIEEEYSFRLYDRNFKCIGYAGERYGPTLIWQVQRI